ncbi:MAG: hypothetical protein ACP6IY_10015 [Promethearchaeia archaeon]
MNILLNLSNIEIINGLLSTFVVILSVFIGIKISYKYKTNKDKTFLFFGLTWILLVEPWYPSMISFLLYIFIGVGLNLTWYLFLGLFFIPLGVFLGVTAFTELIYKNRQRMLQIIIISGGAVFDVIFLYFLLKDPTLMGELISVVDIKFSIIVLTFLLVNGPICVICGALFARESLKSQNPEIRLRGILLIIAFTSFAIGAVTEILINESLYTLIARVFLIFGIIFFHEGFILSNFLRKKLLKE